MRTFILGLEGLDEEGELGVVESLEDVLGHDCHLVTIGRILIGTLRCALAPLLEDRSRSNMVNASRTEMPGS